METDPLSMTGGLAALGTPQEKEQAVEADFRAVLDALPEEDDAESKTVTINGQTYEIIGEGQYGQYLKPIDGAADASARSTDVPARMDDEARENELLQAFRAERAAGMRMPSQVA